jgi:5-methylcytosine-specific restriction protein B
LIPAAEPREISDGTPRKVQLQNSLDAGENSISIPPELFILGTMNSADRSIAIMDMAVRRRFAFVDIWPDINVINEQKLDLATDAFSKLQDIFTQYASQDAFALLPGHPYFLANSAEEFSSRMKYDLLPLLNEYLLEGRLSSCESELRAYMDWLDGKI